jgi:ABC-type dipeptide/oligopeptide/nickel transport system permease subunit
VTIPGGLDAVAIRAPSARFRRRRKWRDLVGSLEAAAGLVVLALLATCAVAAPVLAPYAPTDISLGGAGVPPSAHHWFGQDQIGRDILTRVIYGARLSLVVGLIAVGIALAVGAPVGLIAGYAGGALDLLVMRVIDVMMAFPSILLAILVVAVLGPGLENAMIAVGIAAIPLFARLMRASVLSVKEIEYVVAARALGQPAPWILMRHVAPNCMAPLVIQATLRVGTAILTAASLSFLGLGVQPPTPEWGAMVSEGRTYITTAPHITIFPGLAIVVTVLGFNILGDALNDRLNPRLRRAA